MSQEVFFQRGTWRPKVWIDYFYRPFRGDVQRSDDGHTAAMKNSNKLLHKYAPRMPKFDERLMNADASLMHHAKALSKAMLGKAEDLEWKSFHDVRRRQFRSYSSFSPIYFSSALCIHRGDCENAVMPYAYMTNLDELKYVDQAFQTIRKEKFVFVCLNNGNDKTRAAFQRGMESLFPQRAPFERSIMD